jgi:hypothetical protein
MRYVLEFLLEVAPGPAGPRAGQRVVAARALQILQTGQKMPEEEQRLQALLRRVLDHHGDCSSHSRVYSSLLSTSSSR